MIRFMVKVTHFVKQILIHLSLMDTKPFVLRLVSHGSRNVDVKVLQVEHWYTKDVMLISGSSTVMKMSSDNMMHLMEI